MRMELRFWIVACIVVSPFVYAQQEDSLSIVYEDEYAMDTITEYSNPFVTVNSDSLQHAYSQNEISKRDLDKEKWKKATEALDYEDHREKPKEEKKSEEKTPAEIPKLNQSVSIAVLVIILAVFIIFLLRALGVNIWLRKKIRDTKPLAVEDFSDEIPESELERWLREALQRGDFRLAVRVYYLMAIKELADRKWILWRKEKTNHDYLVEMLRSKYHPDFREVTRIFERAWYGEHLVSALNFDEASGKFKKFISEIRLSS